MDVARSESRGKAVAFRVEDEERVIADRLEVNPYTKVELPRFRGRVWTFGSCRRRAMLDFIAHRRLVVEGRVPAVRVVPALEEVEDRDPRLGRGREAPRSRSSHSRVAKKLSQRALS